MRKKIIVGIAAVAIGAAIALNINVAKSSDNLSDIFLSNVEALANDDVNPMCPTGCYERDGGCGCNGLYSEHWYHPDY